VKKIIIRLTIGTISLESWGACNYNFDATTTEIQQMIGNPIPPAKKLPYLN